MGCSYECVHAWGKVHRLILNRIEVINQMHGCRYVNNCANPCRLVYSGGCYCVRYCGVDIASWRLYDMESIDAAFARIDLISKTVWAVRRNGWASLYPVARAVT